MEDTIRMIGLSPRPLRYQDIKDYILDGIANHTFRQGSKIPPELELAKQFGVSRMTVNRAIRELANTGILLRFAGDGTYVAERKEATPLLEVSNIAQEIQGRNHHHGIAVRLLRAESASEEVSALLSIPVHAQVFHSLLIHKEDGIPVQYENRYVNPVWAEDYLQQDFSRMTPNSYLLQHCPLTDIEHTVEAIVPGAEEQALLEIPANEPCLQVLRRSWSHKNLVSFARLIHPGSRYKLRSQIHVA
jgi:GntR family histidine utilization transcriptional repressor